MKVPSLSLQARFLIAPAIGILLALILYFFSSAAIQSNTATLQTLNKNNLPYIAQVSSITVQLIENHAKFNSLLVSAIRDPDEERIYVEGREIIDELHDIEAFLRSDFQVSMALNDELLNNLSMSYQSYQQAVVSALEIATVDAERAEVELLYANRYLQNLNQHLVELSLRYVENLNSASNLIENGLEEDAHLHLLAATLIVLMVLSAWFSASYVSRGLKTINGALLQLAEGNTDVELPEFKDGYLRKLSAAVLSFRQTLKNSGQARQVAESSNQAKSEFLMKVSHDIRTPVNAVVAALKLMSSTQLDDEQRQALVEAQLNTDDLLIIINKMLNVSNIESGAVSLENVEFDLRALLQECIDTFTPHAEAKGLTLSLDAKSELPYINGDPLSIRQILDNLIANAIKFTYSGGIRVVCDCDYSNRPTPLFNCAVTDTGIGLAEEKLEAITEEITQLDIAEERVLLDTELGLRLVSQLCHMLGGKLRVTSEEGRGSCFQFQLPLRLLDEQKRLYETAAQR